MAPHLASEIFIPVNFTPVNLTVSTCACDDAHASCIGLSSRTAGMRTVVPSPREPLQMERNGASSCAFALPPTGVVEWGRWRRRERAVSFVGKLVFGQTVRAGHKYTTHTEITSPLAAVWRKAAPFDSVTHRYVGQAWVLQLFCDTAGFPAALHLLSATVCQLPSLSSWHVTARVFWPVPHSLLHPLHAVLTHLTAQAAALHALLFAGSVFVALVVQN